MSRRPPPAAHADARPDGPSRRTLIGAVTAAPLLAASAPKQSDQCVGACEHWLSLNAAHDQLARRWSKLEAKLAREHDFLKLSRRQQRKLPEAQDLFDLDDRIEEIYEERQALLKMLPTVVATSAFGLAGKLAVAAMEVCPDENAEAHHLIASILRDLKAMLPAGT